MKLKKLAASAALVVSAFALIATSSHDTQVGYTSAVVEFDLSPGEIASYRVEVTASDASEYDDPFEIVATVGAGSMDGAGDLAMILDVDGDVFGPTSLGPEGEAASLEADAYRGEDVLLELSYEGDDSVSGSAAIEILMEWRSGAAGFPEDERFELTVEIIPLDEWEAP